MTRSRNRLSPVLAVPLWLLGAGTAPTSAQNFESFYGEVDWRDRGEDVRAVRACPGGGSIAAGTRTHPTRGAEALVTRIDALGAAMWQRSYRIDGAVATGANAIIELRDGAGGFVLAGSATRGDTHMFATRIDCDGDPRWTRWFANQDRRHRAIAWDLVEIPATATRPRPEILVIGDEQSAAGGSQGRIARLDADGSASFDIAYADPTAPPGLRFRAAVLAPSAAGTLDDLVVAGSAGRFSDWNFDRRTLMFRARIDGTPVCNSVMGAFDSASEDYFGAATLHTPAALRGHTVLAGATAPAAGTAGQRGYLTRFRVGSCAPLQQAFWPFPNETAHVSDVHEYAGAIGATGRIAVAGTVSSAGFSEGYAAWASSTTLLPLMPTQRFGLHGSGGETLRAIDPMQDRLVLTGSTRSDWDGSGDGQDLFLVQPAPTLTTACSLIHTIAAASAALPHERFEPVVTRLALPGAAEIQVRKTSDAGYCCALSPP